jgi:hypothetical protein
VGNQQDSRDAETWVVLELAASGERLASKGTLEKYLRSLFPDQNVFVPYLSYEFDGRSVLFNVMEGYCFVESGLDERYYISEARESPYLKRALYSTGLNCTLNTVSREVVSQLSDQLSRMFAEDISVGMRVGVKRGICSGLSGEVLSVNSSLGTAQVLVELRSLRTIRTLPCFALLPREEKENVE